MQLSFWEKKNWFSNITFTIVGSGIVGLFAALRLREKYPYHKILILEKGILPQGASTKNAGFACFGSMSELLNDLKTHSEQEIVSLVQKRILGLELLRKTLGDSVLDFQLLGGYELFTKTQQNVYETCLEQLPFVNDLLKPLFEAPVFQKTNNHFNFKNIQEHLIFNPFEGQLDTGNMMQALIKRANSQDILILNHQNVLGYLDHGTSVTVQMEDFSFETQQLFWANNGFASELTNNQVKPARAQVLITKPIESLKIKGTFHADEGYYYFRNYGNSILLGGGRNLDFDGETTTDFDTTDLIQNALETLLKTVILPQHPFEIEQRWSGIMGVGKQKQPIVKSLSTRVHCGVRMGGMGVAIGSLVGKELADLTHDI
jgi:glycine/D-amino acid oxidase-like deaminating enzyme